MPTTADVFPRWRIAVDAVEPWCPGALVAGVMSFIALVIVVNVVVT